MWFSKHDSFIFTFDSGTVHLFPYSSLPFFFFHPLLIYLHVWFLHISLWTHGSDFSVQDSGLTMFSLLTQGGFFFLGLIIVSQKSQWKWQVEKMSTKPIFNWLFHIKIIHRIEELLMMHGDGETMRWHSQYKAGCLAICSISQRSSVQMGRTTCYSDKTSIVGV